MDDNMYTRRDLLSNIAKGALSFAVFGIGSNSAGQIPQAATGAVPRYILFTIQSSPTSLVVNATTDVFGQGAGVTTFNRSYIRNTSVSLSAPTTVPGYTFNRWIKNGTTYSYNPSIVVTASSNATYLANYTYNSTTGSTGPTGPTGP